MLGTATAPLCPPVLRPATLLRSSSRPLRAPCSLLSLCSPLWWSCLCLPGTPPASACVRRRPPFPTGPISTFKSFKSIQSNRGAWRAQHFHIFLASPSLAGGARLNSAPDCPATVALFVSLGALLLQPSVKGTRPPDRQNGRAAEHAALAGTGEKSCRKQNANHMRGNRDGRSNDAQWEGGGGHCASHLGSQGGGA